MDSPPWKQIIDYINEVITLLQRKGGYAGIKLPICQALHNRVSETHGDLMSLNLLFVLSHMCGENINVIITKGNSYNKAPQYSTLILQWL